MSDGPAGTLRQAALKLLAVDDVCQHPDCGCAEELHVPDADGATWCRDCYDEHPYVAGQASDVPEQLRGPLADVFEAWARMGELDPDLLNRVGGPETLAVARTILGKETGAG